MSAVAVFLVAAGIADLCRRAVRTAWPPLAIGPVVVVGCAALAGLRHRGTSHCSWSVGIDEVTEYFLVGSFASWLLALGGIALILAT